ncbi:glycerol acyltransferase [Elysia marginata]|uniref:Glycerol acyltransferase n=1 Tax=Elysia marginata TaxID=1093978 RepID=A0AAV4H0U8_9GAST|nr:glycerol acyltransferase [Elysia marginata]
MTASAIGSNLIQKSALHTLAKLNRNFIITRDLSVKEALEASKVVSAYIHRLLTKERRSVWIAQRQGRTKDGNDQTEQGILKMLLLNRGENEGIEYLERFNIIPVSISYEFDPTDILKIPELIAKIREVEYVKTKNEDFNTILKGIMGRKGRPSDLVATEKKIIGVGEIDGAYIKVGSLEKVSTSGNWPAIYDKGKKQ